MITYDNIFKYLDDHMPVCITIEQAVACPYQECPLCLSDLICSGEDLNYSFGDFSGVTTKIHSAGHTILSQARFDSGIIVNVDCTGCHDFIHQVQFKLPAHLNTWTRPLLITSYKIDGYIITINHNEKNTELNHKDNKWKINYLVDVNFKNPQKTIDKIKTYTLFS